MSRSECMAWIVHLEDVVRRGELDLHNTSETEPLLRERSESSHDDQGDFDRGRAENVNGRSCDGSGLSSPAHEASDRRRA